MASPTTPAMIATTMVPWYWLADGVAIPARLQTSQIDSSGPISRPHLMQCRCGRAIARLRLGHGAGASRSPAAIGTVNQFSCGASGQLQRSS